ncbi:hypothetical protein [Eggerthella sp. YY7918]|uniref:hypothetical protein n=1 Tax=Eggerthella sp. (strain YY7918) TaxID=502558 RepID=UPI001245554D|nr:hypothetical protein [Eggerthella sp. YY7918]
MKVAKTDTLPYGKYGSTIVFLDGKKPHTGWKQVKIGGKEYTPVFMSGFHEDKIALQGIHDLAGMEVEFI